MLLKLPALLWSFGFFPLAPLELVPTFSRFQVVGASSTHVAFREIFDVGPSSQRVNCGYQISPRELGEHGVRLHLVPYQVDQLTPVATERSEVFPIYDSVSSRQRCTRMSDARERLRKAKAAAQKRGLEMDARQSPFPLSATPIPVAGCRDGAGAPRCAGSSLLPELMEIRWKVEATHGSPEAPEPAGPLATPLRAVVTLEVELGAKGTRVSASTEGRDLSLQPLQLYRFEGRVVFLAAFREGSGAERPFLLVVNTHGPVALDDDEPLAPLVVTDAP